MHPGKTDLEFAEQLLRIAEDPDLRWTIYERLGEYCHRCRNQLNSLKLSIYLARKQSPASRPCLWTEIERDYQVLEQRVDQLQTLCRPITLSRVTLGIDLLLEDRRDAWTHLMSSNGRDLEFVAPAERAVASFDVERLGRALDLLVEWRAGEDSASDAARLRWWVDAGYAHLTWEESRSGPRLPVARPPSGPFPWTMPLISRMVKAHDGDYRVHVDPVWRFEVSWPSQPPSP